MQPHEQRVVTERDELQSKIEKLSKFLDSETYATLPQSEQERMLRQLRHMNDYREVLDERIAAFPT